MRDTPEKSSLFVESSKFGRALSHWVYDRMRQRAGVRTAHITLRNHLLVFEAKFVLEVHRHGRPSSFKDRFSSTILRTNFILITWPTACLEQVCMKILGGSFPVYVRQELAGLVINMLGVQR